MAEAHKTAAHVAKTASRIYRAIRSLKKCQFDAFAKELGLGRKVTTTIEQKYRSLGRNLPASYRKDFDYIRKEALSFTAKTWLEYSYAWKPLLKDVYDHAAALAETCVEHQWVMREAKAHHKTDLVSKDQSRGSNLWDYGWESKDEQWQAMEVRYSIPPGTVSAVRAFGLQNPLEVVYQRPDVPQWVENHPLVAQTQLESLGKRQTLHVRVFAR
jgi:hypothetical protein